MPDNGQPEGSSLQPRIGQAVRFDPLNPGGHMLDLGSLTQEQQNILLMEYTRGTLDVSKQAAQMHIDVTAFKNMLDVMANKTREIASQEGTSVQMQHTQESSVGKTEIIMGNTAQAASGRLTRTMAGDRNMTLVYVIVGIVTLLVLVSIFVRH